MNNIEGTSAKKLKVEKINRIIKEEAEEKLRNYSSISKFDDNKWVIDKINKDKNMVKAEMFIYFSGLDDSEYLTEIKIWIIMLLIKKKSVGSCGEKIKDLRNFFKHTNKENDFKLMVLSFYNELFNESNLKNKLTVWNNIKQFFFDMEYYEKYNAMNKIVVPTEKQKASNNEKYIEKNVVEKLDLIMKQENVPIAYKTIYWLLRLIPNRITEVTSMTINCLKQIDENTYMLSIPTFKQAGQYYKGSVKLIEIKYDGMGKYLVDLIKEQLSYREKLNISEENTFLFHSYNCAIESEENKIIFIKWKRKILINCENFNGFLNRLITTANITNANGELANVTTHCFRHNAITDRLTSGIFRPIDIMGLTAHHNTKMIEKSYTHYTPDDLRIEDKSIVFRGKIINTDNTKQIEMILKKPYAYSIHGLGICSDVSGCDKNKSECYRCPYMIPDFDQLERYKMEMGEWKKKKEKSDKIGNVAFSELCEYWIESYEILIQRILKAISNEDLDIE